MRVLINRDGRKAVLVKTELEMLNKAVELLKAVKSFGLSLDVDAVEKVVKEATANEGVITISRPVQ